MGILIFENGDGGDDVDDDSKHEVEREKKWRKRREILFSCLQFAQLPHTHTYASTHAVKLVLFSCGVR